MIRWSLLLALAAGLVAYSFWLYLRLEIAVPSAKRLAAARAAALVLVLLLLFDVRLPAGGPAGASDEWVLLDASLSMSASSLDGVSAWTEATSEAAELERQGWQVVSFGGDEPTTAFDSESEPLASRTLLAPVLDRAAEAGVRRVRVLSDFRLEDAVAVRSALESLPLEIEMERAGPEEIVNAGVSALEIPDVGRPSDAVGAEVEIHAAVSMDSPTDSVTVRVYEEGNQVAEVRVAAPSPGLRARVPLELPPARATGRVRYTATVSVEGDAFPSDDEAVAYVSVGHEEGALVLISLRPDWEPRYLLPLLEDVTGLPGVGYMRAGPDRFVPMGRALDRGAPVDSATVRQAASSATLFVLHGLGRDADGWVRALARREGRTVLLAVDAEGAELAGIPSGEPRAGEWYASGDVPMSPIAGSLAGITLQDLPPLSGVLLPTDPARVRGALLVQLRGAGTPEAALQLDQRAGGRVAVGLAQGFWRWAARENGRDVYRRLWSGVAGWLLAGEGAGAALRSPCDEEWVSRERESVSVPLGQRAEALGGEPERYGSAGRSTREPRVVLERVHGSPPAGLLRLPRGDRGRGAGRGRPLRRGRRDARDGVSFRAARLRERGGGGGGHRGRARWIAALRTRPWPYLLVIGLLCAEWIGRRRSGLR